jgi:Domain of unknown function (DUF4263)
MSRLDRWSDERRLRPIMFEKGGKAGEEVRSVATARWAAHPDEGESEVLRFLRASHEIIFELRDDEVVFHLISWSFDPETFEFVLSASWEMSGFEDANDVQFYLARALIEDVPVYPNTPGDDKALIDYYRGLIEKGVIGLGDDGEAKRFRLTRYAYGGLDGSSREVLEDLSRTEALSPGEMRLLQEALRERAAEHVEAAKVLAGLRSGIAELNDLLNREKLMESELQACLTRNPLLFGAQYREVLAKHRLGSEYEMDYALVRLGGLVDLIEIERSIDKIFNKNGDPSARLIHAEQQVLDWLAWVDEHGAYARKGLPGLDRPVGYVVIGRDSGLNDLNAQRLRRRNSAFANSLEVLTFDDLLRRAESLLLVLTNAR